MLTLKKAYETLMKALIFLLNLSKLLQNLLPYWHFDGIFCHLQETIMHNLCTCHQVNL